MQLTFAVATCQDHPSGYYTAYRDMVGNDLDLVLHLGDYTYEYFIGGSNRAEGVQVTAPFEEETVDLRTYRLRHTLYKLDPDLQSAHAALPVRRGVGRPRGRRTTTPGWPRSSAIAVTGVHGATSRRIPGLLRAPTDPPRPATRPPDTLRIYRRLATTAGSPRSRCSTIASTGRTTRAATASRCAATPALRDDYTMLGRRQERWVEDGFDDTRTRWSIVGQQLLLAELEHLPYENERYWNDAWDGYPKARQRLLDAVVDEDVRNPVFFTGDWHSTFVNDLKLDFKDPGAPTVATEFVTPAITTGGDGTPYGPYYGPMVPFNPHIKYFEGDRRGYMKATVTRDQLRVDLRFMTSVEDPAGTGYTERTFYVEDRRPGAVV